MPNYEQDAIDARETLKEDGQLVRVRVYTNGSYDEKNSITNRTWVDSFLYGAMFDYSFSDVQSKVGEEVEQGDKRLYLATIDDSGNGVVITPGNVDIKVGDIEYKVAGVNEVNPAGIAVLYDLHMRR